MRLLWLYCTPSNTIPLHFVSLLHFCLDDPITIKKFVKFTFSCCCFAGTRVFRVYAEDKDESERNSKITYSIVSTDDKFSIDPETGWLSTKSVRISDVHIVEGEVNNIYGLLSLPFILRLVPIASSLSRLLFFVSSRDLDYCRWKLIDRSRNGFLPRQRAKGVRFASKVWNSGAVVEGTLCLCRKKPQWQL